MKKLWLFGTYAWQGNVKALFMYMYQKMSDEYDAFWVADTEQQAETIREMGYPVIITGTDLADELFAKANVYVNENFRESYPDALGKQTIILNLWHGVGLKHVELARAEYTAVGESVVKKYVRNFELFKDHVQFLTTSKAMEKHFVEEMPLDETQIIRGGYPRNFVYKDGDISSFNHKIISGKKLEEFDKITLFSPTYRFKNVNKSFKRLLPNLNEIQEKMIQTNQLFIIKLHPFMLDDQDYIEASNVKLS